MQNSLVGLCLDRSLAGVVCALGVLKAGAAYLPLDPAYPLERLAFMLNDAQPRVLITTHEDGSTTSRRTWQVIAIDRLATSMRRLIGLQLDRQLPETSTSRLSDLAYVIYTSGSTGRPKGVEITHASLMNLVAWHQRAFEITPTTGQVCWLELASTLRFGKHGRI